MLEYDGFQFAAPPRTGSTWASHCFSFAGLGNPTRAKVHVPPPIGYKGFVVSLVRHPYDWLVSYYLSLKGGAIGVPEVDVLVEFARHSNSPDRFVDTIAHRGDLVTQIFNRYKASTVMRVEDFPMAMVDFLIPRGVKKSDLKQIKEYPPQNCRRNQTHVVDKKIRRKIVEANAEFCELYEYW